MGEFYLTNFLEYLKNTFFLESSDSLRAQGHCNLLAVDLKSFLLKIWLKNTAGSAQREANVLAVLLSFTG